MTDKPTDEQVAKLKAMKKAVKPKDISERLKPYDTKFKGDWRVLP